MDKRSIVFVIALSALLFFVNHWFDRKPTLSQNPIEAPVPLQPEIPSLSTAEGEYYVLENAYSQVVFSTAGGSIAELNLPFHSSQNPESLVRPIAFDTAMEKQHPHNDYFPQKPFWKIEQGKKTLVSQGTLGGYYPLLRRNLVSETNEPLHTLSPRYFAFTLYADDESLLQHPYEVTAFTSNQIEFTYKDEKRTIRKTYSLLSATTPYCLELQISVEGDTRGLWLTTGIPEVELLSGNPAPTLKYLLPQNQVESLSLPKEKTTYSSLNPYWVSDSNGFLGIIAQPLTSSTLGFQANKIEGALAPTRLSLLDAKYHLYPVEKYPGYEFLLPLRFASQTPLSFRIFAGPYQDSLLKSIDSYFSQNEKASAFSEALSFQGWFTFISEPFGKLLFFLMQFFYSMTHSWGLAIILLTIALRVMLYPLNAWTISSSLQMQKISPQIAAIQEKYKKDPKRAQLEIVSLYREKKVNPLSGCLPVLIQIPFLIGMFDLLKSVFELRGVGFIPGWITNLTAPDVLFSWNYPIFFFGTSFHLLPFLLGAAMYVQQKFSSQAPKDPALLTDAQKQQKLMGNIMVVVFSVMFYHFPSGLNIYWLSSTLLGMLQQWMTGKKILQKSP